MRDSKQGGPRRAPNRRGIIALIIGIVAIILLYLYANRLITVPGSVQIATGPQLASVTAGSQTSVVCEVISSSSNNSLEGYVLERANNGSYQRTNNIVHVVWGAKQQVSVGRNQDIHQGAIVQADGHVDAAKVLHADQLSVITNFIKLQ
ncbi:hypothetical protein [Dictyobacter formicarum]|uniref:DUF5666 domain-containing protein n=1 Tax=Dictyobacter formicarum TaxID=2778368 RepID=A0ABQ3V8P3_9CHLR|nr:hypothetical protein [Dictyobacter formicarum]GHO82140.1 hypothetical protein KSZ_01460 [Dictyobacter formicarum]